MIFNHSKKNSKSASNTIFRKDFLELIRDGRALVALGVIILLAIVSFALSTEKIKNYELARNLANQHDWHTWVNQGSIDAHSAAHFSSWAFKPQFALSIIDPGLSPYYGDAIWMEAHKQNFAVHRAAEDFTEIIRFSDISPAWLLATFLPMILIGLGFSSLAREREGGQWKQMMTTGVIAKSILYGKSKLLLIICLIITLVFTIPAVLASLGLNTPKDAITRWILIFVTTFLYSTAILGITLAVSAISKTTRGALISLVGFWMICIVLAPRFAGSIIEIVEPVPSSQIFFSKINEDLEKNCIDGHELTEKNYKKFEENILKNYRVSRVEELPISLDGLKLQACEDFGNQVFDRYFGELKSIHYKQQNILRFAGIFSPVIAFRNATAVFSGNDVSHHWNFVDRAEEHRRKTIKILNHEMVEKGGLKGFEYKLDKLSLEMKPKFSYSLPSWKISKWAYFDLLILLFWSILGITISFFALKRWRV